MTTYTSMLRRSVPAVVTVALCVVLSGCGATGDATSSPSTEWTGPTNPVVTPKPPTPANGETLTIQEQIDAAETAGLTVYEMADGSKVAIDPALPLPEPVAAEGVGQMQAQFLGEYTDLNANDDASDRFELATGKHIIFIYSFYGSDETEAPAIGDSSWRYYWGATREYLNAMGVHAQDTPEALVAIAEAWVATQPNPEIYQIIVVPQP